MAGLDILICGARCPERTGATAVDLGRIIEAQEGKGNTPSLSKRCLGVCALINSEYPGGAITAVRISGTTSSGAVLDNAPALAGYNTEGEVVISLLKPEQALR